MKVTLQGIKENRADFEKAKVKLPDYDVAAMQEYTRAHPVWLHMGGGNIFHGFIGSLQEQLLDSGDEKSGIIAISAYDGEAIEKIEKPHDSLKMSVTLLPDKSTELQVIGAVSESLLLNGNAPEDEARVRQAMRSPDLQLVSFTITEKGYALKDLEGNYLPQVKRDLDRGPKTARNAMTLVTALLYERFQAGRLPVAMVSMDNCSHNGDKLKDAVLTVAREWLENKFVNQAFLVYLNDPGKVSLPWNMIDKITPRPDPEIAASLKALGIESMEPVKTARGTFIAPFVNAEKPQYLVVEDSFPAGRPALEKAGVLFTTKEQVDLCERMKVTTCLNPLHTALAVYGCILGYERISAEMDDQELVKLVRRLGYDEGLRVVDTPDILSPRDFLTEVIEQRLTNRCLPDSPQRIATDTSLKVPVRFGQTLLNYQKKGLDATALVALPLAIAGWLRYLLAVDDEGKAFELSDDPQAKELQEYLKDVRYGDPDSVGDCLRPILSKASLFGVSLYDIGLADKVTDYFKKEIAGPGSVRATLIAAL